MVLPNVLRTVIPIIVAMLIGWAAKVGLELPNDLVTGIVTVVTLFLYQGAARWLEVNVSPVWGRVLLAAGLTGKTPKYE